MLVRFTTQCGRLLRAALPQACNGSSPLRSCLGNTQLAARSRHLDLGPFVLDVLNPLPYARRDRPGGLSYCRRRRKIWMMRTGPRLLAVFLGSARVFLPPVTH